jgi:hypothetical protein
MFFLLSALVFMIALFAGALISPTSVNRTLADQGYGKSRYPKVVRETWGE